MASFGERVVGAMRLDANTFEEIERDPTAMGQAAGVIALSAVSIGLAYPEPVSSAALGPDWQCTRLAFVLTTCRRSVRTDAAAASARRDADCPRRMILVQRSER